MHNRTISTLIYIVILICLSARTYSQDTQGPNAPPNLKMTSSYDYGKSNTDGITYEGNPQFQWTKPTDVGSCGTKDYYQYAVTLQGNNPWTGGTRFKEGFTTLTNIRPGALTTGRYTFWVQAQDNCNNWGTWGSTNYTVDTQAPIAPTTLNNPANPTTDNTPNVTWNGDTDNLSGIWTYDIEFTGPATYTFHSSDRTLDDVDYGSTTLANGSWNWRIKVTDVAGNLSSWSVSKPLTVQTDITGPNAPGNLRMSPGSDHGSSNSDGITYEGNPQFQWTKPTDVGNCGTKDYYQYAVTSQGNNPWTGGTRLKEGFTNSTSIRPGALTTGRYTFWVQAQDNCNNWGTWGSTNYTVDTQAPTAPTTLNNPGSVLTTSDNTPNVTWSGDADNLSGVWTYDIEFKGAITDTFPSGDRTLDDVDYNGVVLLDGAYIWKVRVIDIAGNVSVWSNTKNITISIPTITLSQDKYQVVDGFGISGAWVNHMYGTLSATVRQEILDRLFSVADNLYSGDPISIVATSNYVTVVWFSKTSVSSNFNLFRRRLNKLSQTWDSRLQITNVSFDDVGSDVVSVLAYQNNIFVAFRLEGNSNNIKFIRSMDEGASFSSIIDLPNANNSNVAYPQLCIHNNNLYCAWYEGNNQLAESNDLGLSWILKTPVPNSSESPVGLASVNKNLSVIDIGGWYYESTNSGASWSNPVLIDQNFNRARIDYKVNDDKRFIFYSSDLGLTLKREKPPNLSPIISISISPTQNVYSDSVQLFWTANDSDGVLGSTISLEYLKVDSTIGGIIGSNLTQNGSLWWNIGAISHGSYFLYGRVVDNNGAVSTSVPILININHSPSVSFDSQLLVDTIRSNYIIRWSTTDLDHDTTILNQLFYHIGVDTNLLITMRGAGSFAYGWSFQQIPISDSIYISVGVSDGIAPTVNYSCLTRLVSSGGCSIVGTIFQDSLRVPNVMVRITGSIFDTTLTDSNGHYRFGNIPTGTYKVQPIQLSELLPYPSHYARNFMSNDSLDFHLYNIPDKPILIAPVNQDTNRPTSLTFNWCKAKFATKYHLQIARDSSFTVDLKNYPDTSDTSYQVDSLNNNDIYYWHVKGINIVGMVTWSEVRSFTTALTSVDGAMELPLKFILSQNYPNPFNSSTTIKYGIPHSSHVSLSVYNTLGQRVALLVDEKQEVGYHQVTFDGSRLASGVYFYRIQAGNFVETKKLLLIR